MDKPVGRQETGDFQHTLPQHELWHEHAADEAKPQGQYVYNRRLRTPALGEIPDKEADRHTDQRVHQRIDRIIQSADIVKGFAVHQESQSVEQQPGGQCKHGVSKDQLRVHAAQRHGRRSVAAP